MWISPYSRFAGKELTLNDYLAIDRTILANERTLLAYGRTALAMLVVGGSCMKFFDALWIQATGAVFAIVAAGIMAWGWRRYHRTRKRLTSAFAHVTNPETEQTR